MNTAQQSGATLGPGNDPRQNRAPHDRRRKHDRKPRRGVVRIIATPLVMVLLATGLTGCVDKLQNTIDALNNGIAQLTADAADWPNILQNTETQLNSGLQAALADVEELARGLGDYATKMSFCIADYWGRRAGEGLQSLLHKYDGTKYGAPATYPVICDTNPSDAITAGDTNLVVFYGYDLMGYGQSRKFTSSLYDGDTVIDANFGSVNLTSSYQAEVGIQGVNWDEVMSAHNPRLVLEWGGSQVGADGGSSSLPIIVPRPKTTTVDVEIKYHIDSGLVVLCDWIHDLAQPSITAYYPVHVPAGWKLDTSQGDQGHPGITYIKDNGSHWNSMQNENYQGYTITGGQEVRFKASICANDFWGAGALYDKIFRLHLVARASTIADFAKKYGK